MSLLYRLGYPRLDQHRVGTQRAEREAAEGVGPLSARTGVA